MTNAEIIAQIRAEIERLKSLAEQIDYQKTVGFNWALDDILSFLSDLEKSEEPINQEADLEKELNHLIVLKYDSTPDDEWDMVVARHFYELGCRRTADKYDEIEYNRQRAEESEKPMNQDELENEIEKYREEHEFSIPAFQQVARHFAQWGEHHAKEKMRNARRTEEAYQEVAKEMRKQISGSSEIPNDLEEAARKYQEGVPVDTTIHYCGSDEDVYFANRIVDAVFAGAKWQAEHTPLPEDTVLFNMGMEEGRRLAEEEQADLFTVVALDAAQRAKEQMMKEAVEGEVCILPGGVAYVREQHNEALKQYILDNFKTGDKVKIIIVKEG